MNDRRGTAVPGTEARNDSPEHPHASNRTDIPVNATPPAAPIFIHSLWRAGSTYMFHAFRRSAAGYWAYQEPVHEAVLQAGPHLEKLADVTSGHPQVMAMRHPRLDKPYFDELIQVSDAWRGRLLKRIIYDDYFGTADVAPLAHYLQALIDAARGRAVFQECRGANRIGVIKGALGGVHLYLWRNPWDQWWSFKVNDYFDAVCLMILGATPAPPEILLLRQEIGYVEFHRETIGEEFTHFQQRPVASRDSYLVFYMLWCLAMLEARQHADLTISMDRLSESPGYRDQVGTRLAALGIEGVGFSDCMLPRAFYDKTDRAFFAAIEERAHALLLAAGHAPRTIATIARLRAELGAAPMRTGASQLKADLRRVRDAALAHRDADAERLRHLHQALDTVRAQLDQATGDIAALRAPPPPAPAEPAPPDPP